MASRLHRWQLQYNKTYCTTTTTSADDNTDAKVQLVADSSSPATPAERVRRSMGYDTIYMIKQAIEKAGETQPVRMRNAESAGMTFDGVTGKFAHGQVRLADQVRDRAGNEGRQAGVQHHRAA